MLDVVSCTECGRCQDACPAWATGKALSPKLLVMGIRDQVLAEGQAALDGGELSPLVPNAVTDEVVWDCVTCGACIEACPVSIEHVDHIVDLRRHLVMVESRFPAEAEPMLRDIERASNPWGKPQTERASWADELGVRVLEPGDPAPDVLYWVGCAASFDERARKSAESTAKLLQAAGVDFAILGPREACTGDPGPAHGERVRLPGLRGAERLDAERRRRDEDRRELPALLQHARERVPGLRRHASRSSTTPSSSPSSCATASLAPAAGGGSITYHDSCYLARHNDVREAPRELVAAVGQPIEMKRSGKQTFCCGAGGAHMWMEERGGAINEERVREAVETGAETLAVACPFCTVMLDDGVRAAGSELRVADVSTLLAESLEGER